MPSAPTILRTLAAGPCSTAGLRALLCRTPAQRERLAEALEELELAGEIDRDPTGRWRLVHAEETR